MGRTAGQPEIPGDDVPGNGPSQGREDDSVFNNGGVDDAGTNSMGNLYAIKKAATKLKKAAQMTAYCGERTLVETMVEIELAAS